MAKFVHSDVLDNGLNAIKSGATRMLLISSYSAGESYATVTGKIVAEVVMASADFTLGSSGNNRTLTVAAKSGATATGASGGTTDHIAFTNGVDKVLWVTEETGSTTIAINDTVNFPSLVYTSQQPV